ncbi:hypothetical protein Ais01nite_66000 [Asanoa ishikariensis]|uniref:Uncharacterized protein n=1 Tax=Asanoa ishikariensis TaxID=137265 RepID=A0A1H3NJY7_9ACTN|nr:hypothetical protein [Asanoa ishikariensis]GIF68565.1 hypothetical protein Ais01nite_66000 [Asanoa ishikariensis]SDY89191.1 hypothetical protein SAMN05421684_2124 [Asanoa ishikariensis]
MSYDVTGALELSDFQPDANSLFVLLDGLTDRPGESVTIEDPDAPGRLVSVRAVDARRFDVRWRDGSADAVDLLLAHQLLLRFTTKQALGEPRPSAEIEVDYALTGLSITNAMLDRVKRRQPAGAPGVRWNGHNVVQGDIWKPVSGRQLLTVEFESWNPDLRHGVWVSLPEAVLWPEPGATTVAAEADVENAALRVTNVYEVGGARWSRIDRWSENAGMLVDAIAPETRRYRCSHYASNPPNFDDLVFTVTQVVGPSV